MRFFFVFFLFLIGTRALGDASTACKESFNTLSIKQLFFNSSRAKAALKEHPGLLNKEQIKELMRIENLLKTEGITEYEVLRVRRSIARKNEKKNQASPIDKEFAKIHWDFRRILKITKLGGWDYLFSPFLLYEDAKAFVSAHPRITSHITYLIERNKDPELKKHLPHNPHNFYKEFTTFDDFRGKYYNLEEGKAFFKRRGFQTAAQFERELRAVRKRRKDGNLREEDAEFERLHSNLVKYWKLKEQGLEFADLFPKKRRRFSDKRQEAYFSYKRVQKEILLHHPNILDARSYASERMKSDYLRKHFPPKPHLHFKNWKKLGGWNGFLGKKPFTVEEIKDFFQRNGFQNFAQFQQALEMVKQRRKNKESLKEDREFFRVPSLTTITELGIKDSDSSSKSVEESVVSKSNDNTPTPALEREKTPETISLSSVENLDSKKDHGQISEEKMEKIQRTHMRINNGRVSQNSPTPKESREDSQEYKDSLNDVIRVIKEEKIWSEYQYNHSHPEFKGGNGHRSRKEALRYLPLKIKELFKKDWGRIEEAFKEVKEELGINN